MVKLLDLGYKNFNFNSNDYLFNVLAHETKTFKAPFKASDVHEQCGISFRTPPFPEQDINSQILVSFFNENILYKDISVYKPGVFLVIQENLKQYFKFS